MATVRTVERSSLWRGVDGGDVPVAAQVGETAVLVLQSYEDTGVPLFVVPAEWVEVAAGVQASSSDMKWYAYRFDGDATTIGVCVVDTTNMVYYDSLFAYLLYVALAAGEAFAAGGFAGTAGRLGSGGTFALEGAPAEAGQLVVVLDAWKSIPM